MATFAFTGCVMIGMGLYNDELSMRVMGGILMAPTVIKYSVRAGMAFSDYCCGFSRIRKLKSIGRNLQGKYLSGGLA